METTIDIDFRLRIHFCQRFLVDRTHTWVCQPFSVLAVVMTGALEVEVTGPQGGRVKPALGQVFFLPASVRRRPHLVGCDVADALAVAITLDYLGGLDLLRRIRFPFLPESSGRLKALLLAMEELEKQPDDRSLRRMMMRQGLAHALVSELLRCVSPSPDLPTLLPTEQRCTPAVRWLDEHWTEPVHMAQLSELCHLSRTHFFRLFKQQVGCTPFEYLRQRRVQQARRLLAETAMTVSEIGGKVGWPDPYHFSRMFKAATGTAPSHYRSNWRKQRLV